MKLIDHTILDLETFNDKILNYNTSDCYSKLEFISYICNNVKNSLEGVIDETAAWDFIVNLMDVLIKYFSVFSQDNELNNEGNIGVKVSYFSSLTQSVMEIAPLIKARQAHYRYLIRMLTELEEEIEAALPENIKLARLFQGLLNNKNSIANRLGINEDEFAIMISKMLNDVDAINDILTDDDKKDMGAR